MSKSMYTKSLLAVAVAGTISLSQTAIAYEGGDIIVRSGIVAVNPVETSSVISIDHVAALNSGLGNAGNAQVGLNTEKQLGITAEYMISNKIGVELLAATPFTHDILGAGTLEGVGRIGKTKHLPPTVSAHYYLASPASKFQPYVGLGVNYTTFFDTSAAPLLDNEGTIDLLASLAGAAAGTVTTANNTDIELDDSIGLALQIGFDLGLTDNLSLNASYWKIDIDTEATVTTDTNVGRITASVDVDVDPSVFMVGLAYKF